MVEKDKDKIDSTNPQQSTTQRQPFELIVAYTPERPNPMMYHREQFQ